MYRFEGNANDNSANTNNGTVDGNVALTTGAMGQAYDFPGAAGDHIEIPYTSDFDLDDNYSISMWVKYTDTDDTIGWLFSRSEDTSTSPDNTVTLRGAWSDSTKMTPTFALYKLGSGWKTAEHGSDLDDANWHHVVGVKEGNTMRLYVDGEASTTNTGVAGWTSTGGVTVRIGDNWRPTGPFTGNIDEVIVWDMVLSPTDVKRVMLGMHPLK